MTIATEWRAPSWNQMTPEWRASIKLNGCITNPCLYGDETCPCWVAAQKALPPRRPEPRWEREAARAW